MTRSLALSLLLVLVFSTPDAAACTTFCFKDGDSVIFGRNYDFEIGVGLVMVNKRGVEKTGSAGDRPAKWTSRYGSLTFNQFGKEYPTGGMNERGLVVELMWLDGSSYPTDPRIPTVSTLEWIQLQLDRHATVAEVVQNINSVRIASKIPLHFLIADPTGDVAGIEFLNGKPVIHRGKNLPVPAMTNTTYAESLELYRKTGPLAGASSEARFTRTAGLLREKSAAKPIDRAFEILASVAQANTRWSIVYDLTKLHVFYRSQSNDAIRGIRVGNLDFDCATPVRVHDVNLGKGELTKSLEPYSSQANTTLIRRAYKGTSFLRSSTEDEIAAASRHGDAQKCAAK